MRRLRLLALVAAVAACAGPSGPTSVELGPGEGVVEVRLVSNLVFPGFSSLWVKADLDGTVYELSPAPRAVVDSRIFVGALPAGRYAPVSLHARHESGGLIHTVDVTLGSKAGRFRIAPGTVTNLGTLIYQPGVDQDTGKEIGWLLHDATPVATREWLATLPPALATTVASAPELGWEKPPGGPRHAQLRKHTDAGALGVNRPVFDDTGAIYAGARLGQVRVREPAARGWRALGTGSVHEILAVLPLSGGRLLAGGEEGFLAYSADRGAHWQRVPLLSDARMVIFLGRARDGMLYLVAQGNHELVVFASRTPEKGWRELRRFGEPSMAGGEWTPEPFAASQLVLWNVHQPRDRVGLTDTRLVVYVHPQTLWSYEFATGRWQASEPAPMHLYSVQATTDGSVYGVPGFGDRMYGTHDFGRTWEKLDYFTVGAIPPVFTSRTTGYMGARPLGFQDLKLLKTSDGAASWSSSGELEDFHPERFVADDTGRKLLAVTLSQIYLSSDEGKTWRLAD